MREIKFRGKRVDNGLWVYGYFMKTPITTEFNCNGQFLDSGENGRYCIVQDSIAHEIDIKTLGQFVGLKDINGKDIYEGDILLVTWGVCALGVWEHEMYGFVVFKEGMFCLDENKKLTFFALNELENKGGASQVIGNIYENPELLEVYE